VRRSPSPLRNGGHPDAPVIGDGTPTLEIGAG
jgi:hypothetical protein